MIRRKGSKEHAAVDTLGGRLALHVTPAISRIGSKSKIAQAVQDITDKKWSGVCGPRLYRKAAEQAAQAYGIQLEVI